jgi:hypothetical protein
MNTDYARFTPELVERYFQRCLFYGVWPGFFDQEAASKDPYWASAKRWYERDRPLFKRYIPLLQKLTTAGWQPLTHATCQNTNVFLERFGPDVSGTVYVTLLNDTGETQAGVMDVDSSTIGLVEPCAAHELISAAEPTRAGNGWNIKLLPNQVAVLAIQGRR